MSASLQKLLTWLSPAFPVGAFAWSGGLETAIAQRTVHDSATTQDWVTGQLLHGNLRTDAIFLAHAHADATSATHLQDLADLCLALTPARQRHLETCLTGVAFLKACAAWPPEQMPPVPDPCPYPIAIGAMAASHHINRHDTLVAFLTASVQTQLSVAVRLVPIGQSEALEIMAALEADIAEAAITSAEATLAAIGTVAYGAEIAQMQHENLPTRIFRS
jgi:urease accessory protein